MLLILFFRKPELCEEKIMLNLASKIGNIHSGSYRVYKGPIEIEELGLTFRVRNNELEIMSKRAFTGNGTTR